MRNKMTQFVLSLLFLLSLKIFLVDMTMAENTTMPVNVGVVLDMDTLVGKMGFSCISMALSDFYASHGHYKTRLVLNTRHSKNDTVGAAAAALDLIKNVQVQAIIGPSTSMQAGFMIDLGSKSQVPIITFSATSPSISSIRNPYFFRASLNDSSQVNAIIATIQEFGWREAVLIYVGNEYGKGVIPSLTGALQQINTRVPYRSMIPPTATDDQLAHELYKLMAMQTRVFIVHVLPLSLSSRLFRKAKEIGMMNEGFAWIITDGIGNLLSLMEPSAIESMQGVLGVKTFFSQTKMLEDFRARWKRNFKQDNPTFVNAELNIYGLWAYDAALALAMAVEKVNMTNLRSHKKTNSSDSSTGLETFGISRIGPELRQALSSTKFKGLTGDFQLVDRQLQSSTFQIINVIGKGARGVAFWNPEIGSLRKSRFMNTSTPKANLKGVVIWPGQTTFVPKGWIIPRNGKRLRIGVPMMRTFPEFVNVTRDPVANTTSFTGYCIDVFKAVVEALPYDMPYDFIPYAFPDGAGSYNDLIYQVYLQNYDAVVGDITIRANRSLYVDFTLPYTESGISMVVPIKDTKSKSAWAFFKPLTWELWVTSACFFVFIGFVIWVLEHRINEDFRGPPSQQIGMIFWFSFSTMTFAHKEKVVSNLARFVAIIWIFVVLIMTQIYTASLSSMLTAQQLQPTITDLNELIKREEYVGCLKHSFVLGFLKQMNFNEAKIRKYNSSEDCDELLSKGSANGGVAAFFDEIPYIRVFLSKYCSKYTMVGPRYKTDGFGFVFPRGSLLLPDISRAILNVTQGDKMVKIENKWFGQQSSCRDTMTTGFSHGLGLNSFWGLFLIAGVASISAFIIYAVMFLHQHRHTLMQFDQKASLWSKITLILRHFDQKDLDSHIVRKDKQEGGRIITMDHMNAAEISSDTNFPPSPSSYSNHTNTNGFVYGEQGTPSSQYSEPSPIKQTPRDLVSLIELATTNQERPGGPDVARESN